MSELDYATATLVVHEAMLAAFPDFVGQRVAALGVDRNDVAESVEVGRRWLQGRYRDQRELPPGQQRRSPLELFQAACAFPTERLEALGVEPVDRDDVAAQALPGDLFDLAPVSSQEMGQDVFEVHMAWGIARAAEIAGVVPRSADGPRVVTVGVAVITGNLMDRTRIVDTAKSAGVSTTTWRNPGAVEAGLQTERPTVAFVDLEHRAADDIIRRLSESNVRIVAYGPHVDDIAMARARALGAGDVVARSRLFTKLVDWIPTTL